MPIDCRSIIIEMTFEISSEVDMRQLGESLGANFVGGEVVELIGDIGAGKTTFTKGLAKGMGIEEVVQSPTFTISRLYSGQDELELRHYDFYRLADPGIMIDELNEVLEDKKTVVVIEWAESVHGVLPDDRLQIKIEAIGDDSRKVNIIVTSGRFERLLEELK